MKRKIIALTLTVIMIMSVFNITMVSASYESDEQLYVDLGIFPPKKTTGLIKPSLTREQFAPILVKMQGMEGLVTTDVDLASDISRNKNRNEINFCIEKGYLSVDAEGKFRPYDTISYNDAIRAIITVLEYDIIIKDKSNDNEYYSLATKLGILKGVKVKDREKLSYDELYAILSHSMKINLPIHENIAIESAETLYDRLGVTEYTGVILATNSTSIGVERTTAGCVNIDGTVYRTKIAVPSIYVGTEVIYYIDAVKDEIVSISPSKDVETLELYPSEIESITDGSSYIELRTSGQVRNIKIPKSAIMIVNNKTMAPTKALFNSFKDGYAIMVDTDNDTSYDVIHMSIAKTVTVSAISELTYSIRAEYIDDSLISLQKAEDQLSVYMNGETASFSDIKKGHVASIICDEFSFDRQGNIVYDYDNISWAEIFVSNTTISGIIDSVEEENIYIDDMDFVLSGSYNKLIADGKKEKTALNEAVIARLDNWGYVADIEVDKENSGYSYGYLIKAGLSGNTMKKNLEMKILDEKGKIGIYQTSDRFLVDGKSFKTPALEYNVGAQENVDFTKRQVISFRVANDGRVKSIDTQIRSSYENDSSLTKSPEIDFDPYQRGGKKTPVKTSVVNKKVAIGENCVMFLDQAGLGNTNPEDYYFSLAPRANYSETEGCYIALYDTDDMNSAKCAAVWEAYNPDKELSGGQASKNSFEYTVNSYMVEKVRPMLDSNKNEYFEITLANYAGKAAYKTVTADKLNYYSIKGSNRTELISSWTHFYGAEERPAADLLLVHKQEASELASNLKRGDLVRISTDGEGKITYLERILVFDAMENTPIPFTGTSGTNMVFANLYKTSSGVYMYEVPGTSGEYEIFNTMARPGVVVYDVKAKEANIYSDLSMVPSMSTGDDVKVWLRDYHNGRTREYFVYLY